MRIQHTPTPRLRLAAQALALLLTLASTFCGLQAARAADDFLDPEVAFAVAARAGGDRSVDVSFTIAPGYYLYRDQFKFSATGATLGAPAIPPGKVKFDETFQKKVETYRDTVRVSLPVVQAGPSFRLLISSQGCADKGLCYPPREVAADVSLAGFGGKGTVRMLSASEQANQQAAPEVSTAPAPSAGETGAGVVTKATARADAPRSAGDGSHIDAALRGGRFWPVVGVFFLAGLLLSLTPCVLPMLPILSSVIVGHGTRVSRGRGLGLAASYSLGMALVYTALGVAAGLAGEGLAAALQNPWVLGVFALGLVGLSLSMFGVYELQLPSGVTGRLTEASQRMPAGRVASVFLMGGVSALIVSPCVAAPLAGALVYLSQTRDVWLGGTALFSLAAGMSVPLLLVGASAGALLPRAGAWMNEIKRLFGLLLLAVALWTVQSVLPPGLVLGLWGALVISLAVLLASPHHRPKHGLSNSLWRRSVAAVLAACGLLQLVGAASGGSDPLQPLAHIGARLATSATVAPGGASVDGPRFVRVRSVGELDAALQTAGRPVMLDFYADWCVSCKEMERFTFVDPMVQNKLANAVLLKADVTANNADDRELLKRFQLFGPPGTIFFDPQRREIAEARVIGFQSADVFLKTLGAAGL